MAVRFLSRFCILDCRTSVSERRRRTDGERPHYPGETYIDISIAISFAAGIRASDGWIDTWDGGFAAAPFDKADLPARLAPRYQHPPAQAKRFIAVSVGAGHGVAIAAHDRTLFQWGAGEGTEPQPKGVRFLEVRARSSYNVALSEKGDLYAWAGHDLFKPADLLIGTKKDSSPIKAPSTHPLFGSEWYFDPNGYWFHEGPFTAIAAGAVQKTIKTPGPHVLALTDKGQVMGWGANTYGESSTPAKLAGVRLTAIAAGSGFSIGLDKDGHLHHWGNPLQPPTTGGAPGDTPLDGVPAGLFVSIGAGTRHATAVRKGK